MKKKPPNKEKLPPQAKLLVGRQEAAQILSLSVRSVDYLLANRQLCFRRIGGRILIPVTELRSTLEQTILSGLPAKAIFQNAIQGFARLLAPSVRFFAGDSTGDS